MQTSELAARKRLKASIIIADRVAGPDHHQITGAGV